MKQGPCCKCGGRSDLGYGQEARPDLGLAYQPTRPWCLPCLERDHPEVYALVPDARKAADEFRRKATAN